MMGLAVHHGLLVWGNASLREHGSQFVVHFEAQLALTIYCIQLVKMYGFFRKRARNLGCTAKYGDARYT